MRSNQTVYHVFITFVGPRFIAAIWYIRRVAIYRVHLIYVNLQVAQRRETLSHNFRFLFGRFL